MEPRKRKQREVTLRLSKKVKNSPRLVSGGAEICSGTEIMGDQKGRTINQLTRTIDARRKGERMEREMELLFFLPRQSRV